MCMRDIVLQFSFLEVSVSGFVISVMLASCNAPGSVSSSVFGKTLYRIGLSSSLYVLL